MPEGDIACCKSKIAMVACSVVGQQQHQMQSAMEGRLRRTMVGDGSPQDLTVSDIAL